MSVSFSYASCFRLNGSDIKGLFSCGIRRKLGIYLMVYYKNSYGYARCSVSLKSKLGNAVRRNKEKRIVKEVFRLNRFLLGAFDILIIVLQRSNLSFNEKKSQLLMLYEDVSL